MAEKKSTRLKAPTPTAKKPSTRTRKPKPESEVQQTVDQIKPREVNWDVIGFSSAAVTLAGAALLFMFGWAYEVNWYGYFGVNMSQVNSTPQNVIIQSIPSLVAFFTITVLVVFIFFLGSVAGEFLFFVRYAFRDKETMVEETAPKLSYKFSGKIGVTDWLAILTFVELLLLIYSISNWNHAHKAYGKLNVIYEGFYLEFIGNILRHGLQYVVIIIVLIIVIALFVVRVLKRNRSYQFQFLKLQSGFTFFILGIAVLFTLISISAVYAINDAARGYRGSGGWNIQPMYLVAPEIYQFPEKVKQSCSSTTCINGPLGLIGENDHSYILIEWKESGNQYFPYHPGIFIIPKSESTYLIPFTDLLGSAFISQVSPTPIATLAIKSTFTPTTISLPLKSTITSTATASPSQP